MVKYQINFLFNGRETVLNSSIGNIFPVKVIGADSPEKTSAPSTSSKTSIRKPTQGKESKY